MQLGDGVCPMTEHMLHCLPCMHAHHCVCACVVKPPPTSVLYGVHQADLVQPKSQGYDLASTACDFGWKISVWYTSCSSSEGA